VRWLFLSLLIAVFLPLVISVFADELTVHSGKASFEIPSGWTRLDNDKTFVMVPEDLAKGKTVYLAVLAPRKLDTNLNDWFQKEWKQLQSSYTVIEGGEPQVQTAKAGYEALSATARVRGKDGKTSILWLMGAHVNDRVERFLFVCSADDDLPRYQNGLTAFLSSLNFDDLVPAP
jgi:hypothetical protein